ncbi:MAG: hypothetical protein IID42_07970, partial [Planctomycetes bacterium]|nr:hypothetical protein [Planctomycetota bacterium]
VPLELGTTQWGDFAGPIVDGAALPPDCQLNEDDVRAVSLGAGNQVAPLQWVDLHPQEPDGIVGFLDLVEALNAAINGLPYPWENPCQCAGLGELDAAGLCEPETVNCVAPATITFSEPGAVHLQAIGDFYAGQPPYATVSGGVWYEVEAFGTPDDGSWPVEGWLGEGSFSLYGAAPGPLDEATAIEISLGVELSNVSIRALDVGQAGARVQLFDGDDQLLADDSWVGQTPTGVNEWRYFSFGVSGVRKIKLFQVNAAPDDTVLWQYLQFDPVISVQDAIPAVSTWGVLAMALLVLTVGTLAFARRGG